jgi:signal peptidase I
MSSGPSPRPDSEDGATDKDIPGGPLASNPTPPEPASPGVTERPVATERPATTEQPAAGAAATRGAPVSRKPKRRGGAFGFVQELPFLLIVAFALALLIKTFLVQAFFIPSESMQNTLNPGDRVLVNKVVYHLHHPRRGDIIVFSDPNPAPHGHRNPVSSFWHWLTEGLGVTTSPEKDFIKRVVGLPGETLEGKDGVVYVDGKPLDEPYTRVKDVRPFGPVRIPADSLFVMGDNRTDSKDSRYGLGFIPYDKVIGRAFVVIWPPSRIGWLHGT